MQTIKVIILTTVFILQLVVVNAQNVGDNAPDFSFPSIDGSNISLSDYEGKVLFIFVLGNTCPYCLAVGNNTELEIYQAFKSNPNFAAIGMDTWNSSSSVASVTNFKNSTGITYMLGYKAGDFATFYSTTYDRIIIIDRDGK